MNEDKSYLLDLYEGLETQFENQEVVNFKIKELKKSGFAIQVGGVYGFIMFRDMPWKYKLTRHWVSLSKWIINKVFKGRIETLSLSRDGYIRISLIVEASAHEFNNVPLQVGEDYECLVLQKTDYGLFVDLGFNDHFESGSFVGLIHKSSLNYAEDFEVLKDGDVYETTFFGYNKEEQMVLGDDYERIKWRLQEITSLVGTVQDVTVEITEDRKVKLWVLDKYKAKVSLNAGVYESQLGIAKVFYSGLSHGQIIQCEILKINKSMSSFKLKLLLE